MDEFFTEYPPVIKHPYILSKHQNQVKPIDWQAADDSLQVDRTVDEVSWAVPGKNLFPIKKEFLFFRDRLYWWNSAIRIIYKRTCSKFCS
jgi:deoxyribodipyrimidine photo-lyase